MAGRGPRTRGACPAAHGTGETADGVRRADQDRTGPGGAAETGYTTGTGRFTGAGCTSGTGATGHTTGTADATDTGYTTGTWHTTGTTAAPQAPHTPPHTPRAPHDTSHPHPSLVQIRDLAGRPRGVGFLVDHQGTLLTSHETVDGLARLVLQIAGDHTCVVGADAVTPLPALDLALVRTEGLGLEPLPVTVRERIEPGTYVRIPAGCWREARVLAATEVTYAATDRFHLLQDALELAIGTAGRDALRPGGGAAGGPVLDAETGAVLGVLGTALHSTQRDTGFAAPLRPADGPLAEVLARNAATVPAYGADLNLAGIQQLTATLVGQNGPHGFLAGVVEPVERDGVARELAAFTAGDRTVLGLVGAAGSGRTTELAALAARRAHGERPAPTLWLRGADLEDADDSVADAARRTLERAARIVAAARSVDPEDLGDLGLEHLARLAAQAGRPLLLLLDGPEEMPPVLAHRLPEWARGTAAWLRTTGARLVVACREEYWERAGAEFPADLLYSPATSQAPPAPPGPSAPAAPLATAAPATKPPTPTPIPTPLPPCLRLPDLTADEARAARARYGIPAGVLTDRDARHPLTLRLLSEVRAAAPDAPVAAPLDRHEVFAAHLDLMCLRIAVRLAAESGLRGAAVRRLAARVAGQVHEAARRSLGPGQGELDCASFEAVFPWGPAPARLGGGTGWASAVLTEGLLVPAGSGYRFAHEELADWIQGTHLDLDEALRALVHRPRAERETAPVPVPHHRIGPVVQALLLLARQHGTHQLADRLWDLMDAVDRDPHSWWAARLLARTLLQVPDTTPYTDVLWLLADRIVAWRGAGRPVPGEFGPGFWAELPLSDTERLDLLRRLVLADQAPAEAGERTGERYLDAVARLLAAAPAVVQPRLTRWFDDERPLPATPHATVATAAQALLHTHRHGALDDLTEILVATAHRRADELLATLAEDEPSAVCRAVDRWAHDERPARRVAAVTYGLRAAPHVRSEADRELLRYAALALLARPADCTLHGSALALLVRDPHTRDRHLAAALRHFADGDPQFPPSALAPALTTHPEPVLEAFRARLSGPDTGEALRTLTDVTTPALARRIAALLQDAVRLRPATAGPIAAHVDRRLAQGPTTRRALLPLVTGLLDDAPEQLRAALATVLAAAGTPACRPLRRELLELLLAGERAPSVLDAVLHAAAEQCDGREEEVRGLVHRTGLLLVRTPEGATRFDRGLVDLGRQVPGFAARMARWLADTPEDWAAVVGPGTRRMLENLAGVRVPA
ncbi:trypsin-like peptidase domain-containing protein [Streptomyces sp. NPDC001250]|uniref:trypsin-like peptidase domain-containing protein n=1 Tax=unclassified Streptomyces TaxID=2593676 RepID=UPI00331E1FCF